MAAGIRKLQISAHNVLGIVRQTVTN
jgi:hypothetical protein